jgi:hypothetical protein
MGAMALKRVYSAPNEMDAHLLRGLLEEQGIAAQVMGGLLANTVLPVPALGVAPSVWINEEDVERAMPIVKRYDTRSAGQETPQDNWTCPACGEVVEGQFTDCWNCLTPRPKEPPEGQQPSPSLQGQELDVPGDLPCAGCGYNLRGLRLSHRCPECGALIAETIEQSLGDDPAGGAKGLEIFIRRHFERDSPMARYPGSALSLVLKAVARANRTEPMLREVQPASRRPVLLCRALRDYAIEYLGGREEAARAFGRWNMLRSDDIGRILRALIDANLIEPIEGCETEKFSGLCSMEWLFAECA